MNMPKLFVVHSTENGRKLAERLCAFGRPLSKMLDVTMFGSVDADFWKACPLEQPVGCLLEFSSEVSREDGDLLVHLMETAERLDAHGVSVFLLTTEDSLPVEWAQSALLENYHLLHVAVNEQNIVECEETIIGHLHFARFATEEDVQVFQPSAIKFLRSRQRMEQECFVMQMAERSSERSPYFVKLLARHTCKDFNAIEVDRLDCTVDDLVEADGIKLGAGLPEHLVTNILTALQYLHDWSDVGIHTFGDFRRTVGLPLRHLIPASVYHRHFRHLDRETLDAIPFQIIHCDMKPGNFLLRLSASAIEKLKLGAGEIWPDEVPEVKVFDFDLCRYVQPSDGSRGSQNGPTYSGTYGYTAPELFLVEGDYADIDVAEERRITPYVDFYAVGTTFYETITRHRLIPREIARVDDDEYYSAVLTFTESTDYKDRLDEVADIRHRSFIEACTVVSQAERKQKLQELTDSDKVTADRLNQYLRS